MKKCLGNSQNRKLLSRAQMCLLHAHTLLYQAICHFIEHAWAKKRIFRPLEYKGNAPKRRCISVKMHRTRKGHTRPRQRKRKRGFAHTRSPDEEMKGAGLQCEMMRCLRKRRSWRRAHMCSGPALYARSKKALELRLKHKRRRCEDVCARGERCLSGCGRRCMCHKPCLQHKLFRSKKFLRRNLRIRTPLCQHTHARSAFYISWIMRNLEHTQGMRRLPHEPRHQISQFPMCPRVKSRKRLVEHQK